MPRWRNPRWYGKFVNDEYYDEKEKIVENINEGEIHRDITENEK